MYLCTGGGSLSNFDKLKLNLPRWFQRSRPLEIRIKEIRTFFLAKAKVPRFLARSHLPRWNFSRSVFAKHFRNSDPFVFHENSYSLGKFSLSLHCFVSELTAFRIVGKQFCF